MQLQPYQPVRRRTALAYAGGATGFQMRHLLLDLALGAAEAVDVTTAAQVRSLGKSPVSPPPTNGDTPPLNGKWPRREATLPCTGASSRLTSRTPPGGPTQLRKSFQLVYQLVLESLDVAGIVTILDPFTDRGDGVPVLVRTADEFPKPLLLSCLIPALALVASDYIYQSIIRHGYAWDRRRRVLPARDRERRRPAQEGLGPTPAYGGVPRPGVGAGLRLLTR